MWRNLLEYTDATGRTMLGFAVVAFVLAVVSFVTGIVQAAGGRAAGTLPYWLTTMACAVIAGILVFLASRRGDLRHH